MLRNTNPTCDQHHSALHWQQLNSPLRYIDRDEAATEEEDPVDNRRNNKIQRGHKVPDEGHKRSGPEPSTTALFELPQHSEDVHGCSNDTETGTSLHLRQEWLFVSFTCVLNVMSNMKKPAVPPPLTQFHTGMHVVLLPIGVFSETCFSPGPGGLSQSPVLLISCCSFSYQDISLHPLSKQHTDDKKKNKKKSPTLIPSSHVSCFSCFRTKFNNFTSFIHWLYFMLIWICKLSFS